MTPFRGSWRLPGGGCNWQKVDLKGEVAVFAAYTPFKAGSFSCVTSCYS